MYEVESNGLAVNTVPLPGQKPRVPVITGFGGIGLIVIVRQFELVRLQPLELVTRRQYTPPVVTSRNCPVAPRISTPFKVHWFWSMLVVVRDMETPSHAFELLALIVGLPGSGFTVTLKVSDREKQFGKFGLATRT